MSTREPMRFPTVRVPLTGQRLLALLGGMDFARRAYTLCKSAGHGYRYSTRTSYVCLAVEQLARERDLGPELIAIGRAATSTRTLVESGSLSATLHDYLIRLNVPHLLDLLVEIAAHAAYHPDNARDPLGPFTTATVIYLGGLEFQRSAYLGKATIERVNGPAGSNHGVVLFDDAQQSEYH